MMEQTEIFKMADELKAAKDEKKELEAKTKEVNARIEELDQELSDAMADAECDKFTRNGSTFYLNSRLYASPAAGGRDALIHALKDNGYGSIVTETVNANTLASFCKEQMTANEDELPEWLSGVVNTFEKVTVGIRKK
ncbi:gp33 family protein [Oribacterium sp. HCP28S3_H8]|uniref:gp33 family protein n=1 Tax=Oribacterium sp. HCP28S3_H8 TaxID=3438945 RepID=UPI003F8A6D3F